MNDLTTLEAGPVSTRGYLVADPETLTAVVIDTPLGVCQPFADLAEQNGYSIAAILLTHSHWDHTADCAALQRRTGAPVYLHPADAYRLTDPMAHTIWPLPFTIEPVTEYIPLAHGQDLSFGSLRFHVLHTPGHTEGGVCFVQGAHSRVFAGDTLFNGSVGRVDLPGGDEEELLASIRRELFALPDETVVYCGHGPETTIGRERVENPYAAESLL
jgi:glyoxylase-like metal-dependent hydrolase (beta-lactamase superfamily II)